MKKLSFWILALLVALLVSAGCKTKMLKDGRCPAYKNILQTHHQEVPKELQSEVGL